MNCHLCIFLLIKEIGEREGKFYAINVPLRDGIDDSSFNRLFRAVSSLSRKQPKFSNASYVFVCFDLFFFVDNFKGG